MVKNEKCAKKKVEKIFHDIEAQLKSAIAEGATMRKACKMLGLRFIGVHDAWSED